MEQNFSSEARGEEKLTKLLESYLYYLQRIQDYIVREVEHTSDELEEVRDKISMLQSTLSEEFGAQFNDKTGDVIEPENVVRIFHDIRSNNS